MSDNSINLFCGAGSDCGQQLCLFNDQTQKITITNNGSPYYQYAAILGMIPYGESTAIPMAKLADVVGCSQRDIRRAIEAIRRARTFFT